MPLNALLDIAAENDRFRSLSTAVRAGGPVKAHMSAAVQPFLLATLVAAEHGLGGRPALIVTPDDRSARAPAPSARPRSSRAPSRSPRRSPTPRCGPRGFG